MREKRSSGARAGSFKHSICIQSVSGNSQSAELGHALTNQIEVVVKDKDGKVFSGAAVSFSVTEGSVSPTTAKTDASGKAKTTWALGSTEGTQTLSVIAFKADGTTNLSGSPMTFTATATEKKATSIELVTGEDQTADVGTVLTNPVKILVKDQNGDAFAGAAVNFEVTEGSVSSASENTDASGNASVSWTLGATEGTQSLTVTAFKADGTTALTGSPITVTATATAKDAASIELLSGGDQTGVTETLLGPYIYVKVKDANGNPFPDATVHYSLTEGSVQYNERVTGSNGEVNNSWTLGPTVGTQTLTITAFKADGTTHLTGSPLIVNATAEAGNETGTLTDYDGNVYQTVKIGTQEWMAENLKVTKYPDGTAIPLVTNNTDWVNLGDNDTDDAYCYYNNESTSQYGAIYSYAAANDACPDGWHLPSDEEWTDLTTYITNDGHLDTEGTALKSTTGWYINGNGTDNYGFSALPGGWRYAVNGKFLSAVNYGYWWSSTEYSGSTTALARFLTGAKVIRGYGNKSEGMSVRCAKD